MLQQKRIGKQKHLMNQLQQKKTILHINYHSKSNKYVIDLIHPSLYCYKYGKSVICNENEFGIIDIEIIKGC